MTAGRADHSGAEPYELDNGVLILAAPDLNALRRNPIDTHLCQRRCARF